MHEHELNGNGGIRLTRRQMDTIVAALREEEHEGDVVVATDASGKVRVSMVETVTHLRPLPITNRPRA